MWLGYIEQQGPQATPSLRKLLFAVQERLWVLWLLETMPVWKTAHWEQDQHHPKTKRMMRRRNRRSMKTTRRRKRRKGECLSLSLLLVFHWMKRKGKKHEDSLQTEQTKERKLLSVPVRRKSKLSSSRLKLQVTEPCCEWLQGLSSKHSAGKEQKQRDYSRARTRATSELNNTQQSPKEFQDRAMTFSASFDLKLLNVFFNAAFSLSASSNRFKRSGPERDEDTEDERRERDRILFREGGKEEEFDEDEENDDSEHAGMNSREREGRGGRFSSSEIRPERAWDADTKCKSEAQEEFGNDAELGAEVEAEALEETQTGSLREVSSCRSYNKAKRNIRNIDERRCSSTDDPGGTLWQKHRQKLMMGSMCRSLLLKKWVVPLQCLDLKPLRLRSDARTEIYRDSLAHHLLVVLCCCDPWPAIESGEGGRRGCTARRMLSKCAKMFCKPFMIFTQQTSRFTGLWKRGKGKDNEMNQREISLACNDWASPTERRNCALAFRCFSIACCQCPCSCACAACWASIWP